MVVSPAPMCLGGASTGLKCPSSVMTKTDPELQRFLPQGAFGSLHNLRNLRYWRSCLRMLFQQFDVKYGVGVFFFALTTLSFLILLESTWSV